MFGFGRHSPKTAICYIRQARVLLHASSKTAAGFYTATPPWLAMDLADVVALDAGIEAALAGSKAKVPTPARDANPLVELYQLASVKTWAGFALNARSVHIERSGEVLTFRPMRNLGPRNGFQPIPELAFDVAAGESASSGLVRALALAE
jgi:hypothetical protein